jgi:flagellar basal-body rod protein FlgC
VDYTRAFAISAAGMDVERTRVEVAAVNLAHAHAAQGGGTPPFQPLRAVVQPGGFQQSFARMEPLALPQVSVEPALLRPRLVPDPGHPMADAEGFVAYPGVDPATEMVTLMSAMRSYEANVAAMNTARSLVLKTLEIGRGT